MPGSEEARYQQFVQVLIDPSQLCDLATAEGVVSVEAPLPSAPAGPREP
jgi:hypothetical protein